MMHADTKDAARGLYEKFRVERTDGRSAPGEKHEHCRHFVLDLDHDPFAAAALWAYAESCMDDYPELARDLRELPGVAQAGAFLAPDPTAPAARPRDAFVSACCAGERCQMCGAPSARKVEEVIFHDDPQPVRHPATAYVCGACFRRIMFTPAARPGAGGGARPPMADETDPRFVLHFARAAIVDAITLEDGLDAGTGERVVAMIARALAAPPAPAPAGEAPRSAWWCRTCQAVVPPERVTDEELHDPRMGGCGQSVAVRTAPEAPGAADARAREDAGNA